MNDKQIIDLYFSRSEQSIKETKIKYSSFCRKIAYNILSNNEDTDECENDTYLKIWNSIPPNNPENFKAYIGKITRNIALDIWKKNHTQKRNAGIDRIGNNLNQIARAINDWHNPYPQLAAEVRAAASDLAALKFEVLEKVGEAVGNVQTYQL